MKRILACAAVLLVVTGCGSKKPVAGTRSVKDSRGKDVALPAEVKRVVSIVPGCTELLFAAGAGPKVVGVTTFCEYPAEVEKITRIGDMAVNLEVLQSLKPDVVVGSWGMARRSVEKIESLGIPVFCLDPHNLDEVGWSLRALGQVTGDFEVAEKAAVELEGRLAAVAKRVEGKGRPSVLMELTPQLHVAVPGTYGHDVIVRAGGRNVFDDLSGNLYQAVTWEAVLARDPDVYIVVHRDEPKPTERPGFEKLKASREKEYFEMPREEFMFPTPRLILGIERLAEKLHP